jgi:tetratricopeptide (TPR) repeat protein
VFLCVNSSSLAQLVEELVMAGNKAYSVSDYEKAAMYLETAIKTDKLLPTNVYLILGQSYEALHKYDSAVLLFTSMGERATQSICLELISILAEKMSKVNEARGVWNKLHQKYPNSIENYIGIYKILIVEGDNRSAIDSLKRAMSLFPQYDPIYFYKELCVCFLRMKAYDNIAKLYNESNQTTKCDSTYFYLISDIIDSLVAYKQEDLVRTLLNQQSNLNCLDENKRYKILKSYLAMGDTDAAVESGNKLLELNPSNVNYYYEIALLEEKRGSTIRALHVYKQLYDNFGNNIDTKKFLDLFLAVSNKYQKEGKYQTAIAILSSIPTILSNDPRIKFALAKQYKLIGDVDNARKYAESSLGEYINQQKTNQMDTNIYLNACLCYLVMEDLTKAEGEFQKHLNRSDKTGKEEAVRKLREFASENINKPDAEYLLKKYYEQTTEIAVHSQSMPIEKPKLIGQMSLESFSESNKINPEPDKSYILVHSQIPNLRFDSNRKIVKVNQITSGDWELWLPVGTHILKFDADGFQRLELPPMNFGKKRSYEIRIRFAPPETE